MEPAPDKAGASRRFWLDFGPLAVFFAAYLAGGIFAATAALIPAALIAAFLSWRTEGRVSPMTLFTTVAALVFGGLTIALRDQRFIQMKPTAIYLLFAGCLGFGLLTRRPLLKPLLGSTLKLTDQGWRVLTQRYALFFAGLAGLNEILRRTLSLDAWVTFKVFGVLGLLLVFSLLQARLLERYRTEDESAQG